MNVDEAALLAAYDIEDIYCRHHEGGRNQRLARIQVAIVEAFWRVERSRASQESPSSPNTPGESHERTSRTTGECPEAPPVEESPAAAVDSAAESQGTVAPFPQPAPFPGAQSEGPGKHGGDQRAQKSEAVAAAAEAGAAQAEHIDADRRNSSRGAGEAALAPLPADRTSPAAQRSRTNHALDLWATTELSEKEIAAEVGCALGSVKAFVHAARKKDDWRGFARALPHDDKASRSPPPSPQPVLISRKDEEREPPISGFAKPAERKPFDRPKSSPLDPRPGRIAGVVITSPGSIVSLDMDNLVVACPGGDWQVSRPVALIMERMRNGETFDDQTLADLGSMGLSTFSDSRKRWADELAKRGVEFVHTKGVGCKIRVAGT